PDTLCYPAAVVLDSHNNLYVADAANNRVLEYNAPLGTAPNPANVFGQLGLFTTNTANNGGVSANSLNGPKALAVDAAGDLYVADYYNSRVLEYYTPLKGSGNTTADLVFGQFGNFS